MSKTTKSKTELLSDRLAAIRKKRIASCLPKEKVEKHLKAVFERTLIPNIDFIEESAMVLYKLSKALGECCYFPLDTWVTVEVPDSLYQGGGGFYINGEHKILSLTVAGADDGLIAFDPIQIVDPLNSVAGIAYEMQSHGCANEEAISVLEKTLSSIIENLRKHMKKVDADMDRLLCGRREISALMKCEMLDRRAVFPSEDIIFHCVDALKPLEEKRKELLNVLELLNTFEDTFGSAAEALHIGDWRTSNGLFFEKESNEYNMLVAASLERRGLGSPCSIFLGADIDRLHYESSQAEDDNPSLESQVKKLVYDSNLDKIQLLHLRDALSNLVQTILKNVEEIEKRIDEYLKKHERNR